MRPEWIEDASAVPELVRLFQRCAGPEYICREELVEGYADTASSWSPAAAGLLARKFIGAIGSVDDAGERTSGILSVWEKGACIGFALLEMGSVPGNRPYAFLHDIVVDPGSRGSGVGSALMDGIKAELFRRGIDRIFLESGIGNTSAHAFFERHGFSKLSVSMSADLCRA